MHQTMGNCIQPGTTSEQELPQPLPVMLRLGLTPALLVRQLRPSRRSPGLQTKGQLLPRSLGTQLPPCWASINYKDTQLGMNPNPETKGMNSFLFICQFPTPELTYPMTD